MRCRGFKGICAQLMTAAMLFTGTMAGTMTGAAIVSAETDEDAEAVLVEAVEDADVESEESLDGAGAPSYQSNVIKDANGKTVDLGGMEIILYDYYSDSWEQVYAKMRTNNPDKADYLDWIQKTYNFTIKRELLTYSNTINSEFVDYQTQRTDDNNFLFIVPTDGKVKSNIEAGLMYNLSTLDCLDFSKAKFKGNTLSKMYSKNGSYYVMNTKAPETGYGLYFNKRILQKAGIDPDSLYTMQANGTWTWSAWEDMMDKVQKHYTDANGNVTVAGYDCASSIVVEEAIFSNNGSYVCESNGKYTSGFETAETKEAMEWIFGVIDDYSLEEPEGVSWDYYRQAFVNGEIAFMPEGSYYMDVECFPENMTDSVGFVAFPKGPQATGCTNVWSGEVCVIPARYSQDKAWKLAFAYDLFTDADALFPDDTTEYASQIDEKAKTETLTLLATNGAFPTSILFDLQLGPNLLWDIGRGTTLAGLQNNLSYIRSLIEEDYKYTEEVPVSPVHYYYIRDDGVHVSMDYEGAEEVYQSLPTITSEDSVSIEGIPNETVRNQLANGALSDVEYLIVNIGEESISLGDLKHSIGNIYSIYVQSGNVDIYAAKIGYFSAENGTLNIYADVDYLYLGEEYVSSDLQYTLSAELNVYGNIGYIKHYTQAAEKGGFYGSVTVTGTVGSGTIIVAGYDDAGKYYVINEMYIIGECAANTFKITDGVYDTKVPLTEGRDAYKDYAKVIGTYVLLSDGVTLRFAVKYSDSVINNLSFRKPTIAIDHNGETNTFYDFYDNQYLKPIADAQNKNIYYYDIAVEPTAMTDDYCIDVNMELEGEYSVYTEKVTEYKTSVKKNLDSIVSDSNYSTADSKSSDSGEKYRAYMYQIAVALQNYGLACQEYFDCNVEGITWIIDPATRLDLSTVTTDFAAASYKYDGRTTLENAEFCEECNYCYVGKSLILNEKVCTNVYFLSHIPEDSDIEELYVYDSAGNAIGFEDVLGDLAWINLNSKSIVYAAQTEEYKIVHIGKTRVEHKFSVSNFDYCDAVLNSETASDSLKTLIRSYVYYAQMVYEYKNAMSAS